MQAANANPVAGNPLFAQAFQQPMQAIQFPPPAYAVQNQQQLMQQLLSINQQQQLIIQQQQHDRQAMMAQMATIRQLMNDIFEWFERLGRQIDDLRNDFYDDANDDNEDIQYDAIVPN